MEGDRTLEPFPLQRMLSCEVLRENLDPLFNPTETEDHIQTSSSQAVCKPRASTVSNPGPETRPWTQTNLPGTHRVLAPICYTRSRSAMDNPRSSRSVDEGGGTSVGST